VWIDTQYTFTHTWLKSTYVGGRYSVFLPVPGVYRNSAASEVKNGSVAAHDGSLSQAIGGEGIYCRCRIFGAWLCFVWIEETGGGPAVPLSRWSNFGVSRCSQFTVGSSEWCSNQTRLWSWLCCQIIVIFVCLCFMWGGGKWECSFQLAPPFIDVWWDKRCFMEYSGFWSRNAIHWLLFDWFYLFTWYIARMTCKQQLHTTCESERSREGERRLTFEAAFFAIAVLFVCCLIRKEHCVRSFYSNVFFSQT
jgi:hypothetical protein